VKAAVARAPGPPEVLEYVDVPDVEAGPGEILIDVAATAVNRPDVLQRQGHYPPPPGASEIIGLECSGTVAALGEGAATGFEVGDQVCALLAGGGYATRVAVPAGQVMPVPDGIDLVTAAALPEVAATVWSNLMMIAGLRAGDNLLVHGGAGGIGTFAIQLGHALGARVLTTAGTAEKLVHCAELGADVTINYRDQDFVEVVRETTEGHGADVVLDIMGASYLARNVAVLATEGRLLVVGLQGGLKAELDLGMLMGKRGAVISTRLRPRPVAEKTTICAEVAEHVWPLVADGAIRVVVDRTLPLAEAAAAHARMESGEHAGKIVLVTPSPDPVPL
jgi:putative PIG3 family NAD(P)H quinone oxidoreductase